jgi:cysteine desulfurase
LAIYLDNAATTRLDADVLAAMMPYLTERYGNPSSIHALGRQTRAAIEQARKLVARCLNASVGEVFFTSCGTESNNMALNGAVRDWGVRHIITSKLEHHCVLHSSQWLGKTTDVQVHYLPVLPNGHLDMQHLADLLKQLQTEPKLVSLMHANNEIGNLLNLDLVSQLCQQYNAYFHTDTVQTIGYYPIDVQHTHIDLLSGSGHKFHGPKGVGFIYINNNHHISPLLLGGSQERNMRAGTENVHNIVGLGKAIDLAYQTLEQTQAHITQLKTHLIKRLQTEIPNVLFNGDALNAQQSHYKIVNAAFAHQSESASLLLLNLDIAGICTSGGSACSSGVDVGSHVLEAIDPTNERANIRFSFSKYNTLDEVDITIDKLKQILRVYHA